MSLVRENLHYYPTITVNEFELKEVMETLGKLSNNHKDDLIQSLRDPDWLG